MLGSTLYLAMVDAQTGEIVPSASPCSMCRRLIINAGIEEVIVRTSKTEYKRFAVADWIDNDDTLPEEKDEYHGDKK